MKKMAEQYRQMSRAEKRCYIFLTVLAIAELAIGAGIMGICIYRLVA